MHFDLGPYSSTNLGSTSHYYCSDSFVCGTESFTHAMFPCLIICQFRAMQHLSTLLNTMIQRLGHGLEMCPPE